jgi:hypothetical protein
MTFHWSLTGPAARETSTQVNGDLQDRLRSLRDIGALRHPGPLTRRFQPQRLAGVQKRAPQPAGGGQCYKQPVTNKDRANYAPVPSEWDSRSNTDCDRDMSFYRPDLQDSGVDLDNMQETAILNDDVNPESPPQRSPTQPFVKETHFNQDNNVTTETTPSVKDTSKQNGAPAWSGEKSKNQSSTDTASSEKATICGSVFLV